MSMSKRPRCRQRSERAPSDGTIAGVPVGLIHRSSLWLAACAAAAPLTAQERSRGFADALLGRWDLTVEAGDRRYPSWLEVQLRTEASLMGRFVGRVGSVRYASQIDYADGRLRVIVPVQYESGPRDLELEARLAGERLEGTMIGADGRRMRWTGERAPALERTTDRVPGAPIALFNGTDLRGWTPRSTERTGCWSVSAGELAATPPCVDLMTEAVFDDFVLHAELMYPRGSNSGIYLRGRYEVQIQDDAGYALDPLRMGAIYGFIAPAADAARGPGEWQSLDVTLRGRRVTVVLNGATIVNDEPIPGITGGALDSAEGAPGPIMLQGDHGPVRFRSLTLTPYR